MLRVKIRYVQQSSGRRVAFGAVLCTLTLCLPLPTPAAPTPNSLPTGGEVIHGKATVHQHGRTLTVQQVSDKVGLNWQTFNIGKKATVNFHQPSNSSLAVNRIADPNGSEIFGHLNANGQVWLINPSGIVFGPSARVNVGGLVASTLNRKEGSRFAGTSRAGVINKGKINGGYVAFLGHTVSNQGQIHTPDGTTALGAGSDITLHFADHQLLGLTVSKSQLHDMAENGGLVQADGGKVLLTAGARDSVLQSEVNNTGVIEARGLHTKGGVVRLVAHGGNTRDSGHIDVSGTHGGSVQLLADRDVMVSGHAQVNASGTQGGGKIRVGGGVHGSKGLLRAERTYVAPNARLHADATQSGDGGSIAVWSTDDTVSMGTLTARGGTAAGDGGFVETSGLKGLTVTKAPNVGALNGQGGTWLVDPYNLDMVSGGAHSGVNTSSPFHSTGSGAELSWGTIASALGSGNVKVTTGTSGTEAGDISVKDGHTFDSGDLTNPVTLTLDAAGSIDFDSGVKLIDNTNQLSLDFDAEGGGVTLGEIRAVGLDVTADGGITQNGKLNIVGTSSFNAGGGDITLTSSDNEFTGAMDICDAGDVELAGSTLTLGTVANATSLELDDGATLTGDITVNGGRVNLDGAVTLAAPSIKISTTGGGASSGRNVNFDDTVDSANSETTDLSVKAGTGGTVTFGGKVGENRALGTLHVSAQNTVWSGGSIQTSGKQTYDSKLDVNNRVVLKSDGLEVTGTVDSSSNNGIDMEVQAGNGDVEFQRSIGSDRKLGDLDIKGKGGLTFAGTVEAKSLSTGTGVTTLNGDVTTTSGTQSYGGDVLLGKDVTLKTNNHDVEIAGAVDNATSGTPEDFTINTGSGDVQLSGAVGGTHGALGDLDVSKSGAITLHAIDAESLETGSGTITLMGDITTQGTSLDFDGDVTLDASSITISTTGIGHPNGAKIEFQSMLDGTSSDSNSLVLDAGTGGALSFDDAIGSHAALAGLCTNNATFQADGALYTAGNLSITTTAGAVTQNGGWTVGGTSAIDASNSAITLTNPDNDFGDAVSLTGGTTELADSNALTLGTVDTGELTVTSNGALDLGHGNVGGTLSATSNGGEIRQSGALDVAGVSMIDAGSAAIQLDDSDNNFRGAVSLAGSDISLQDSNDVTITTLTNHAGGAVSLIAGGTLTLPGGGINTGLADLTLASNGGSLTTTGDLSGGDVSLTGTDGITLGEAVKGHNIELVTAGKFVNNAGSNALQADNGGHWLIWSQDPAKDTLGGLDYNFKQYNATHGSTSVQGSGNGLLYTLAPTLTISLAGPVAKTYDATKAATLDTGNLDVTGALTGDTVQAIAASADYADKNAGRNKLVTAHGVSIQAKNGNATVYGYQLDSTASGAVGTITPATLTYEADRASGSYSQIKHKLSGKVTGFVGGDNLTNATTGTLAWTTPATASSASGTYAINGGGLSAANYIFTQDLGNASALNLKSAGPSVSDENPLPAILFQPPTVGYGNQPLAAALFLPAFRLARRDSLQTVPHAPPLTIVGGGVRR